MHSDINAWICVVSVPAQNVIYKWKLKWTISVWAGSIFVAEQEEEPLGSAEMIVDNFQLCSLESRLFSKQHMPFNGYWQNKWLSSRNENKELHKYVCRAPLWRTRDSPWKNMVYDQFRFSLIALSLIWG